MGSDTAPHGDGSDRQDRPGVSPDTRGTSLRTCRPPVSYPTRSLTPSTGTRDRAPTKDEHPSVLGHGPGRSVWAQRHSAARTWTGPHGSSTGDPSPGWVPTSGGHDETVWTQGDGGERVTGRERRESRNGLRHSSTVSSGPWGQHPYCCRYIVHHGTRPVTPPLANHVQPTSSGDSPLQVRSRPHFVLVWHSLRTLTVRSVSVASTFPVLCPTATARPPCRSRAHRPRLPPRLPSLPRCVPDHPTVPDQKWDVPTSLRTPLGTDATPAPPTRGKAS